MIAADILRERARLSEERVAGYGIMSPDELRAVAELILRCRQPVWQVSRQGNEEMVGGTRFLGHRCLMCMSFGPQGAPIRHSHDCPLAALERLIEGERE